jgi:two-component system chemotaxis response regulator CheB
MKNVSIEKLELIICGSSDGGLQIYKELLPALPADFPLPLVIVQHLHKSTHNNLLNLFSSSLNTIKFAADNEPLQAGHIYFAPANYHLLFEDRKTIALSIDEAVNYSRPSIDVSMISAADIFRASVLAILLSGANSDGSRGMEAIHKNGGTTIIQDLQDSHNPYMPQSAFKKIEPDYIMNIHEIILFIKTMLPGEEDDE